jgi:SAM-dependent methyltransferase
MNPVDRRTTLRLLLAVFAAGLRGASRAAAADASNFRTVYLDDDLRQRFYLFLRNVFRLYPEDRFDQLILESTRHTTDDADIYRTIQARLPDIKPRFSQVTYALPALAKQKEEMAGETADLLGPVRAVSGYVEIGTPGRYVKSLRRRFRIDGEVLVVNDVAPGLSLEDVAERGQLRQAGAYVPLGNYDPLDPARIPDASVDLVTNFIGFHHVPAERLDPFVASIGRVLRPGGKLVVRDHDARDADMVALVALAHDVFNAGVGLSWDENHRQVRNFTSTKTLEQYLETKGFVRSGGTRLQDGDPTKNALMLFLRRA